MSASARVNFTSPVGRIVLGSLYTPNTKDAEGKPLVVKNGPNVGQARSNYFFALAVPKGPERHWAETPWGAIIWGVGHAAFPQAAASPSFAWKIEDGDSSVPNKRGRKPVDNEGWKGHWILKLSGGFAPKVYKQENGGYVQILEEGYIKPGYYVEVAVSVDGNGSQSQPGIYLNHSMVCFRAFGPEITFGPDVASAGFGQSALPAGASLTPPPSSLPMPAAAVIPGASVAAPIPAPVAAPLPMVPPVPITPNPAFLQGPGAPPAPPAVPTVAPPPASGPRMTAAANGVSYQAYLQAGWSDALLISNGLMVQ